MKALGLAAMASETGSLDISISRHLTTPIELPSRPPLAVDTCRGSEAPPTLVQKGLDIQGRGSGNNLASVFEETILDIFLSAGWSCTNDETPKVT